MRSPDRWRVVLPLLDRGLELAPPERGPWLAGIAADDPELARELETLLARHAELAGAAFLAEPLPTGPVPSLAGQRCGPYTLVSPIGRGGMGTVWLAERSDGRFTGIAAVKLLNASLLGHEAEARFRREGTILARLRHPHIARLVDAGVSPQGQPYLVLEHVDGRRIDEYCETAGLDLDARLRLFLDVMAAVSHAHASLVVHRDLKPSNVMVDADGRVKLLDFGIAKLLEGDADDTHTALTRDGHAALTPAFASPEQLSAGAITTATDVYALGVLLYLLLAGRHPTGSGTSPAELVRGIVEVEPPRASQAGGRFAPALRGDLDAVLTKALRKQPEDRYASVDAMADDVRRYLAHEPVSASEGSVAYRAGKFVRRHRLAVAAAAVVLLTAAAGTTAVIWQARVAQRERNEALAQLARATATNDFMNVMLNVAAPGDGKFSVSELLEHGSLVVDKQFASDPSMRAELLTVIGRNLVERENLEQARGVLDRALAAAKQTGERALIARAQCPRALLQAANGEIEAGEALMAAALADVPDDRQHALLRAECLLARSSFGYFTQRGEPMIRDANEALALIDRAGVPAQLVRIEAVGSLAYGHYLAKHTREADAAYTRFWSMLEQAGLERTSLASAALNNWALLHYWGDLSKAEALCRRAVALARAIEATDSVTPTLTFNHAGTLTLLGRFDEAQRLYEETIASARARQDHRVGFDAAMELGWMYSERGEFDAAERQLATLDAVKDTPRFDPWRRQLLDYYRAGVALNRGNYTGARALLREVAARFEQRRSKITKAATTLIYLARAEHATGHPDDALAEARKAIALAESFVEPGSPSYLIGLARLAEAEVLSSGGEAGKAREAYRLASGHLRTTLGQAHPATRKAERGAAQSTSQEASSPPVRQ